MKGGLKAERLFTGICNRQFIRGFVFHSPKYFDPQEREAGDIVLWVRDQIIVVELIARVAEPGASTKQFVKRIGEKRRQLQRDYEAFANSDLDIQMINEMGELVSFDTKDLGVHGFSGIIIVDCFDPIDSLHFRTIEKSLETPFPLAVMTRIDFEELLSEVDTITDLTLYLKDRTRFAKQVFSDHAGLFLNLNRRFEQHLISFYKLHENSFSTSDWDPTNALNYREIYHATRREEIEARNEENEITNVIDELIEKIREANQPEDSTLLHSWELATLTRRQRATYLAETLHNAFDQFDEGRPSWQFAYLNLSTGCWLVFYFQSGGSLEGFRINADLMTKRKIIVEIVEKDFEHSVFGYAFYKSPIETSANIDAIKLTIEDAISYTEIAEADYQEALQYFGKRRPQKIREFPR